MILGDRDAPEVNDAETGVTLDALLHVHAQQAPLALALIDPPNRAAFTSGAPRILTYAQADRAVSAIAARLRELGLPTDAVIGIQLPNTAESLLTCLGVMRAGMIPALLPLLWRRRDIVAALSLVGAKAIVTCGFVGTTPHADIAMHAAVDLFGIKYVFAYGADLPDGVVPLDDVFLEQGEDSGDAPFARNGDPSAHVAAITFDTDRDGLVAVARDHRVLIAGADILEPATSQHTTTAPLLLSALPISSFAGLSLTLARWLLSRGTLFLHHPFEPGVLARQLRDCPCASFVAPGPLLARLADAGLFSHAGAPAHVYGVWRAPEQQVKSARWPHTAVTLIDVLCFGEIGHVAVPRDAFGRPAPLMLANADDAPSPTLDIARTISGTLGLRGSIVPHHAFPPALRGHEPIYGMDEDGVTDTGYPCRHDDGTHALVLTGAPRGIVTVGGCRFRLADLDALVRQADPHALIVPSADALLGQRLSGRGSDQATLRMALTEMGAHPLICAAFRDTPEDVTLTG